MVMNTMPAIVHQAPALSGLTNRQRAFVMALLRNGSSKGNRQRCAKEAGYQGDSRTLRVTAHKLFHNPAIKTALHELAATQLVGFQLMALDGIAQLAESAKDEAVKLKALLALADRSGLLPIGRVRPINEDLNQAREQRLVQMTAMCAKNRKLLTCLGPPMRALIEERLKALATSC